MRFARLAAFAAVALAIHAAPLGADAQQAAKIPRIGYLSGEAVPANQAAAFREDLRALGYIEGKSIVIEYRIAQGKYERLPALAGELVRQKVDLIIARDTPAVRAAKEATTTIPIVMASPADAVGSGFVSSLGRPGGNVTGLTFLGSELVGKRVQFIKEVAPAISRVAVLWQPGVFGEGTVKH